MRKILFLLCGVFITYHSFSTSIEVSGNISANTSWAGVDTVKLIGNISVDNGRVLTIEPGIVVEAQGMYGFTVNGTVIASGTLTDSIKFTALNKTDGWDRFMYVSTPTSNRTSVFQYCVFEYGNPGLKATDKEGGAFYIYGFSKVFIKNCLFKNNKGLNATVYAENVSLDLSQNKFIQNTSYCLMNVGAYQSKVYNNKFLNNYGAAAIYSGYGDLSIYTNNLFTGNQSAFQLYNAASSLRNNTIADNTVSGLSIDGDSDVDIYNTIIRNNSSEVLFMDVNSDPNFYYCNVKGGNAGFTGTGSGVEYTGLYQNCVDNDPLFSNVSNSDYSLSYESPNKDIGYILANLPSTDLSGNTRISDDAIDLGAYEYFVNVDTLCGETWNASDSPVHINSNLFIPKGCDLTIEAGTKIIFDGFYKIRVEGSINAQGNINDSVIFTAANTTEGWQGIKFIYNTSVNTSSFKYTKFEYGKPVNHNSISQQEGGAIYLSYFNHLSIENCTFYSCNGKSAVVYGNSSKILMKNSTFANNENYSYLASGSGSNKSHIEGNLFINNHAAIYSGILDSSYYYNNVLVNNNYGFLGYGSGACLINNTIINNVLNGIMLSGNSDIKIYNTILYGNSTQLSLSGTDDDPDFYNCDIEGGSAGFAGTGASNFTGDYVNCLNVAPDYMNASNNDFRLSGSSPLINKGTEDTTGLYLPEFDRAGYVRVEDDRVDIGAYERDNLKPVTSLYCAQDTTEIKDLNFILYTNEPLAGISKDDFVITKGELKTFSKLTEGEYNLSVVANEKGWVFIELPENTFTDTIGNNNIYTVDSCFYVGDTVRPVLSFSAPDTVETGIIGWKLTLNEPVNNLIPDDFILTNGEITAYDNAEEGIVSISVRNTTKGWVYIELPENACTDTALNANFHIVDSCYFIGDTTRPVLSFSAVDTVGDGSIYWTLIANEPLIDISTSDFVVSNGEVIHFTGPENGNYHITVKGTEQGNIYIELPEGACKDTAENQNHYIIDSCYFIGDTVKPSLEIEPIATVTNEQSIRVDVTFSEEITGFELSDISVSNGTASNLTAVVGNKEFTLTITATDYGEVGIEISDAAVTDLFDNVNVGASAKYTYQKNTIGIETVDADDSTCEVYPNPVKTDLFVTTKTRSKITVFDLLGNVVLVKQIDESASISFSDFSNGIYLVKIESDKQSKIFRVVKE